MLCSRLSQVHRFLSSIQSFFTRQLFTKFLSFTIIFSLFANTTPAAPSVMIASASEFGQDVRYAFLTSPTLAWLAEIDFRNNPMVAFFLGKGKQQSPERVVIQPGDQTVMQGEKINFSAIGLRNEQPLNGLKFQWSVTDVGRNRPARPLNDGNFEANKSGTFLIVAATNGSQAQVTVTVNPNEGFYLQQTLQKDEAAKTNQERQKIQALREKGALVTRDISTKNNYREQDEKQLDQADKQKRNQARIRQNEIIRQNPNRGFSPKEVSLNQTPNQAEPEGIDRAEAEGMVDESRINPEKAEPKENTESKSIEPARYRPAEEDGWGGGDWWTADDPVNQVGNVPLTAPDNGVGNGNFEFSAPVLSLGGRGISVNLALTYNSRLWSKSGSQIKYDSDKGYPGAGWNLGFGKMVYMGGNGGCMIVSPDGTRRGYDGTASIYSYGSYYSNNYTGHTTDGSFIDYSCYYSSSTYGTYLSGSAKMADGTTVTYSSPTGTFDQIYPTQIADAQGNYITITYVGNHGPNINTITDTLGRVVTFNYDASSRLISVTGPGFNGGTRTFVRLHYSQLNLSYAFSGVTPDTPTNAPYVLDSIYYPGSNTGYWFGDTDSYSSYGMIAKVIEQRGMNWSGASGTQGTTTQGTMTGQQVYNYPMTANSSLTDAPTYSTRTDTWAGMETAAPVTTYNIATTSTTEVITVTMPNGTKSKQTSYNDPANPLNGLYFQGETLSSSNVVLGKNVTYLGAGVYGTSRVTRIESTDELNHTTATDFVYGANYNQVISQKEYGYTGALYRESQMTYENNAAYLNRHIFNLVKSSEIKDAAGVRLARTDYQYDNNAVVNGTGSPNLQAATGVLMHFSTYDPFTTETYTIPGECTNWVYNYPECENNGGYAYVGEYPQFEVYCPDERYCSNYSEDQILSVYDPNTIFRGNLTQTTTYENAAPAVPTGAIAYNFTYDITGNQRTATTNCCQQMSFTYSTATQFSQPDQHKKGSATDTSLQNVESAVYDFNTGAMTSSMDANGLPTLYFYDAIMRPIQTTFPTQGKSFTEYDDVNLKVTQTATLSAGQSNTIVSQGKSYFNGRGQTIKSESLLGTSSTVADVKYDLMGRQEFASMPRDISVPITSNDVKWTQYFYDNLSRVIKVKAPDLSESQTFYNEASRPSSASTDVGNTVRSQDAWGRERWARTDDFGRLVEVVEPNPNGNGGVMETGNMVTSYLYSPKDELIQVNQGVQERKFAYDSLGRLTRQKLAEQANTIEGVWSDAFQYDTRSNLVQRTDARGVKTNFVYNNDPLNRLQSINYDKSQASNPTSIADAPAVTIGYKTSGNKSRVETVTTAGVSTETNVYDSFSRVQAYNISMFGKSNMTMEYAYDTANRLTSVTYPSAFNTPLDPKVVTPSYDNASRLNELKVNEATQMSDIVYNPLSQVTSLKTGAYTNNADIEEYSYDPLTGLLTGQIVKKQNNNQQLLNLSYNYNRGLSKGSLSGKTGQLTGIVNQLDQNKNRIYEFDTLGRLITAKGGVAAGGVQVGNAPPVTANWTQQYAFDRYGNRQTVTASGVTANNATVPTDGLASLNYQNQSNQTLTNRITTAGYEYDEAGNMLKGQSPSGVWQRFQYDSAGRLVKVMDDNFVELESYTYGASRQRLKTSNSSLTTYYAWGGSSVLCEYTETMGNSGTFKFSKSYIYAGLRLLSTQIWNGTAEITEFHHPDRLGTKLVTNNVAGTSYEQSTLPFGTSLDAEFINTPTTNQRFTSYERSAGTGLDYAVNRSYASGQGRFTQVDPIAHVASLLVSPQTLNLYSYVKNDPINSSDANGLFASTLTSNKCVFNINLKNEAGVGKEEIDIMKKELQRIYGDAGITLVFNNPSLARSGMGSYNLSIVKAYPPAIIKEINKNSGGKYTDKDVAAFNSGEQFGNGWININNFGAINAEVNGYSLARAGGHEVGHYALGHSPSAPESVNHPEDGGIMDLYSVGKDIDAPDLPSMIKPHRFSPAQVAQMKECAKPKKPTAAPPSGGGGGGGGGDGGYRNYDPFRSLEWLLFEQWAREKDYNPEEQ